MPLRFYVVQVLFAVRVHVELFGLLLRGDQQRAGLTIEPPLENYITFCYIAQYNILFYVYFFTESKHEFWME